MSLRLSKAIEADGGGALHGLWDLAVRDMDSYFTI